MMAGCSTATTSRVPISNSGARAGSGSGGGRLAGNGRRCFLRGGGPRSAIASAEIGHALLSRMAPSEYRVRIGTPL